MARMSKTNMEILEIALARLEGQNASDRVEQALTVDAKIYLDSWVKPLIAAVIRNGLGYENPEDYAYMAHGDYYIVNKTADAVPQSDTADIRRIRREAEKGTDLRQLRRDDLSGGFIR